ncbi:MAG: lactate racemase domain-containing protein [Planctomycetota bacterium]|jgi:nickel-dependent lactate racemase
MTMAIGLGFEDRSLTPEEVRGIVREGLGEVDLAGRSLLLIIPDHSRTAPVGQVFKEIFDAVGETVSRLDVIIALGTHPPMSEEMINARVEITAEERAGRYAKVNFYNHEYDNPDALTCLGTIPAGTIGELSEGLFEIDVDVTINRKALEYDHLCIVGPVFPHEVVGFSAGKKY